MKSFRQAHHLLRRSIRNHIRNRFKIVYPSAELAVCLMLSHIRSFRPFKSLRIQKKSLRIQKLTTVYTSMLTCHDENLM